MSSFSINLIYIAKISAKLESTKSVKNNMTDQQQNSDNIINSFNVFKVHQQALLNKISFSKSELFVFY